MSHRFWLVALFVAVLVGVSALIVDARTSPPGGGPRPDVRNAPSASPLGTGFTYQGQLKNNAALVNGNCDLAFNLWDASNGGLQIGSSITQTVPVTNGLFTTALDFGDGRFNSDARWLAASVRCPSGGGSFTPLTPRQKLTPAPYALALPGLYTLYDATSPSIIGGYNGNSVNSTARGATIAGGGNSSNSNLITDNYGVIGGGYGNQAGDNAGFAYDAELATVSGGIGNVASGPYSTVSGGFHNIAAADSSVAAGGYHNEANGPRSFAAGTYAIANHTGAFVWSDALGSGGTSDRDNQFKIGATGGVYIVNSGSSGLTPASLEISSTASGGVAFFAQQNSSDATMVLTNRGSGDLIKAFGTSTAGNLRFRVDQSGNVSADGTVAGGGADFAEWLPRLRTAEIIQPGDIIGVFAGRVTKATRGADQLLVVSTKPAVVGGASAEGSPSDHVLSAFIGQVATRVRGVVRTGDLIVASNAEDGSGIAVAPEKITSEQFSRVVGQAWESSADADPKLVNVAVGLRGSDPAMQRLVQANEKLEARIAALEQANAVAVGTDSQSIPTTWVLFGGLLALGVGLVAAKRRV